PAHQVFLRAYELRDVDPTAAVVLKPFATGKLLENRDLGPDGKFGTPDDVPIGGMATWAVVKAQARDLLGIQLNDYDVVNVPLVRVDAYGNFIPGAHGFAQLVRVGPDLLPGTADDVVVEGNPAAPVTTNPDGIVGTADDAVRTGHQFLIDIAHSANPFSSAGTPLTADTDTALGLSNGAGVPTAGFYDNELLDKHYIAGDGRVNENIGLTAVHSIFHSEHNRLAEQTKSIALASNDLAFLSQWLMPGTAPAAFPTTAAQIAALQWNGERLFQAARFGTEMQYQHLVF